MYSIIFYVFLYIYLLLNFQFWGDMAITCWCVSASKYPDLHQYYPANWMCKSQQQNLPLQPSINLALFINPMGSNFLTIFWNVFFSWMISFSKKMPISRVTKASNIYLYVLQVIYVQVSFLTSTMVISTFFRLKVKVFHWTKVCYY